MKRIILGIIIALTLIGGTAAAYAHGGGPGGGGPGRGVGGQVTAVSGSTITVSTHDGTATITTTTSTTYEVNGAAGSQSDITVGLYVRATGTRGTDGTFTATKVVASTTQPTPPAGGNGGPGRGGQGRGVGGQVTAVSGSTITVSTHDGTATITTTTSTTYEVNGAAGSLSDITVGLYVRATGTRGTDGAFTATKVVASTTQPTPPARDDNGGGRGPRPTATATP